jgi:hypothetical protein
MNLPLLLSLGADLLLTVGVLFLIPLYQQPRSRPIRVHRDDR